MMLKSQWKRVQAVSPVMKVHDIIPRLLPLQVVILQFQLGNVGLVMGQHLLVKLMRGLQLVLRLRDPALHVFYLDPPLMLVEGDACSRYLHNVAGSHPRHQKLLFSLGRSQDHLRHLPLGVRARRGRCAQVSLASWADSLTLSVLSTWSTEEMTAICCPTNARAWRRQKNSAPKMVAMETPGLVLIVVK